MYLARGSGKAVGLGRGQGAAHGTEVAIAKEGRNPRSRGGSQGCHASGLSSASPCHGALGEVLLALPLLSCRLLPRNLGLELQAEQAVSTSAFRTSSRCQRGSFQDEQPVSTCQHCWELHPCWWHAANGASIAAEDQCSSGVPARSRPGWQSALPPGSPPRRPLRRNDTGEGRAPSTLGVAQLMWQRLQHR